MDTPRDGALRIVGVPEHFNLPFRLAIEDDAFTELASEVQWADVPGGTGAMCRAIESGEADAGLLLTEGAVARIANERTLRLAGTWVDTPLIWGVHCAAAAAFSGPDSLRGKRFGVSRFGSGSHLMAWVFARERGWDPRTDVDFVVVNNLDGARAAFEEDWIDAFLWERFTTKPLVDAGEWKHICNFSAPWAAFVMAVHDDADDSVVEACHRVLQIVGRYAARIVADPAWSVPLLARRYGQREEDIAMWLDGTSWASKPVVSRAAMRAVAEALRSVDVVNGTVPERILLAAGTTFVDDTGD